MWWNAALVDDRSCFTINKLYLIGDTKYPKDALKNRTSVQVNILTEHLMQLDNKWYDNRGNFSINNEVKERRRAEDKKLSISSECLQSCQPCYSNSPSSSFWLEIFSKCLNATDYLLAKSLENYTLCKKILNMLSNR